MYSSSKALRILVVEDETLVARDLQTSLQRLGYEVPAVAHSGQEALDLVRWDPPDLVLMDIRLGEGLDGIEATRQLQQDYQLPVVYLTAMADETTLQRARETQPYGYLLKPFHESELRSVVELAVARHQAHAKVMASEAHFVNTLRSMAEGVIATDLLGRITFMNPVAERLTGWPAREAEGRPLQDVFRISSASGQSIDALGLERDASRLRSLVLTSRSGLQVLVEDNTAPIRDAEGGLAGIVVLFRQKAEAPSGRAPDGQGADSTAAAAAAATGDWPNLAGIVQSIADPLLAVDAQWNISYLNSQAAELLGGRRDALLGSIFWDCLPASMYRLYYHEFSQALRRGGARRFEMQHEGRGQWFEVQLYPFGQGLLALLRDVTAEREAAEKERKLEKLESLGLLARGFAHDFNNLLTVLLGNLSLAELQLDESAPSRGELRTAKQAALQAQGLVQHLLTFARGGAPIKQPTDFGRLAGEWFLAWPKKNHIDYRAEIDPQPMHADVDRQQIQRLLHNLLRNAEEAIPRTGSVTLRVLPAAKAGALLPALALPEGSRAEDWILLQVADTGEGISENVLQHVFEPYFTTKEDINASGLGLTVCESIAKAHGATITLTSRHGEGACVSVCLPVHSRPQPEPHAELPPPAPARRTRRKILVLEDEPLIRQLIVANLSAAGCTVETTSDGKQTISAYQSALAEGEPFDLVIMDLSIPNGMGGAQAMERILEIDPAARGIVSSGYSDDPVMSRYLDYGFRAVLPKPYQPKELRDLVENMLRGG